MKERCDVQCPRVPPLLPVYKRAAVSFERGEGAYLFDREGRRYLDFGSGIAVTLLGHAHPHLVARLKEQAEKLWHCSNLYGIEAQEQLAERLVAQSFADTVFFCNSGAEALECAIKMARRFQFQRGQPERFTRSSPSRARSTAARIATISAGGQEKHLEGFRPGCPASSRCRSATSPRSRPRSATQTAAILIEPIQGEGGIRPAETGFLAELRRLCRRARPAADLRRGPVPAWAAPAGCSPTSGAGVTPDIMTLAKGLGGGFPLGACLATARAASGMTPGSPRLDLRRQPARLRLGNAVLDVLLEDGFLDAGRPSTPSACATRSSSWPRPSRA